MAQLFCWHNFSNGLFSIPIQLMDLNKIVPPPQEHDSRSTTNVECTDVGVNCMSLKYGIIICYKRELKARDTVTELVSWRSILYDHSFLE